jgi:heme-degrading monooxygenase HmoA
MISRHWKGVARSDQAEAYVQHLQTNTFPHLAGIAGFVRASILRREVEEGTEFQVVSLWESLDAIRAFAGDRLEVAVVPPNVQAMMVSYDARVLHYDVFHTYEAR